MRAKPQQSPLTHGAFAQEPHADILQEDEDDDDDDDEDEHHAREEHDAAGKPMEIKGEKEERYQSLKTYSADGDEEVLQRRSAAEAARAAEGGHVIVNGSGGKGRPFIRQTLPICSATLNPQFQASLTNAVCPYTPPRASVYTPVTHTSR